MMIGIRMSVKSAASNISDNVLYNRDFKVKYFFELLPKKIGQDKQQIYKVCKFQDYAPNVFQKIRALYNITDDEYLKSIGPDQLFSSLVKGDFNSFTQLTSTGKSGSFFYYTADGKFTLKTINRTEFNHLKQILKNYYEHLQNNKNTLIIKFFGLHKIKLRMKKSMNEQIVCFVIMGNVFHTRKYINEKFDLKGSKYGRITKQSLLKSKGITFKDLDFINKSRKLNVKNNQYVEFMNIIKKDAQFFEENNIIDYSLLVGIHHKV
ncbi:phosphatidylinositol-4-phosphate 5-kinase family protein, putative, partial [Ichthyophthirius multifiliis]